MCIKCGVVLVIGENWSTSNVKKHHHECKVCRNTRRQGRPRTQQRMSGESTYRRSLQGRFMRGKAGAIRKKYVWELTFDQFCSLNTGFCTYCFLSFDPGTGTGLDQKRAGKGYSITNAVPCCSECNVAKSDHFTYEEMLNVIGPAIRKVKEARGA